MNRIIHFIKLNLYLLKNGNKIIFACLIAPALLYYPANMGGVMRISFSLDFSMLMAFFSCLYFFASDEKSDMRRLYSFLPLTRTEIVVGRYLSGIALGTSLILIISFLLTLLNINLKLLSVMLLWEVVFETLGIYLIMIAIEYPFFILKGYSKAQSVAAILPVLVFWINLIWVDNNQQRYLAVLSHHIGLSIFALGFITIMISISISIKIYKKQEF